jgi:hypothetical protein
VDKLNERVGALHDDRTAVQSVLARLHRVEASVDELQQQVAALHGVNGGDAGGAGGRAASVGASVSTTLSRPTKLSLAGSRTPLRRYPELVTERAEPGESRVYGPARPVIVEWRQARMRREQARMRREQARMRREQARRERASTALERLRADERLLELELVLVGEHGLTLPPADRPWDGIRRQSELRLLDRALGRVRRVRRRALLAHWSLRLLTLGLWGLLERGRWRRLR